MFDIMTDIGVNRNYDFSKYDINTFDGDIMLQGLSKDLIDKAWNKYQDYKTNKTQYFVNENIINGTQEGKNYYCASYNRRIWWLSKHFFGRCGILYSYFYDRINRTAKYINSGLNNTHLALVLA